MWQQNTFIFLDRTGLKSAAIWDLRGLNSLPVPVYFKNSDGLTLKSQALCQISASLPSQLYVEPQSRCGVSTEVTQTAPCTMHSDKCNRCACSRRNVLRTNLELHRCSFFCSCNHGLRTGTEKSWGLVRETTAPWASLPFPILIPASRAERHKGSYRNHGQTVGPWGYLWIWDSKTALVVKMNPVNSKWIAEGTPRAWNPGVVVLPGCTKDQSMAGWGQLWAGGQGWEGDCCALLQTALGISSANLSEFNSGKQNCMLRGEECDLAPYFVTPFLKWEERNKNHQRYVHENFVNPTKILLHFSLLYMA